ncbi:hypothetical protein Zmor_025648 [Zophobas morio]|uniref:Uncharacterized protein n=1 Tax=Zophobas morio TaxID=2755281 RepID=A0AA38HSB6_9CUCU|nr:hypothetical protein Zmor_025648 [Zophobas morio]
MQFDDHEEIKKSASVWYERHCCWGLIGGRGDGRTRGAVGISYEDKFMVELSFATTMDFFTLTNQPHATSRLLLQKIPSHSIVDLNSTQNIEQLVCVRVCACAPPTACYRSLLLSHCVKARLLSTDIQVGLLKPCRTVINPTVIPNPRVRQRIFSPFAK